MRVCYECRQRTYVERGLCRNPGCPLNDTNQYAYQMGNRLTPPLAILDQGFGLDLSPMTTAFGRWDEPHWVITFGMRTDRATQEWMGSWGAELFTDYWPISPHAAVTQLHRGPYQLADPGRRRGGPDGRRMATQLRVIQDGGAVSHTVVTRVAQQIIQRPLVLIACYSGRHRSVAIAEVAARVARTRCPQANVCVVHLDLLRNNDVLGILDSMDELLHYAQRHGLPPMAI